MLNLHPFESYFFDNFHSTDNDVNLDKMKNSFCGMNDSLRHIC